MKINKPNSIVVVFSLFLFIFIFNINFSSAVTYSNDSDGFNVTEYITGTGMAWDSSDNSFWIITEDDDWMYHHSYSGVNLSDGFSTSSLLGNPNSMEIDSTDDSFWALDDITKNLSHFNSSGDYLGDGINLSALKISGPKELGLFGNSLYVYDQNAEHIYNITKAGALQGNISINGVAAGVVVGLTIRNDGFWMVQQLNDMIIHYSFDGVNQTGDTFSVTDFGTNLIAAGITTNISDFWFYDSNFDFVYHATPDASPDTTPPTITSPSAQSLEYGDDALYADFNATDSGLSDLGSFSINWTVNFTITSTGELTNSSILPVGNFYLNVSVNDTFGNYNSTIYNVNITDSVPPVIIEPPNATLEYGDEELLVDFNATDVTGVGNFSINWTSNFSIANNGTLINSSMLPIGTFYINVSVNDTLGSLNSTIYQITVQDTTNPTVTISSPTNDTTTTDTGLDITYTYVELLCDSAGWDDGTTNHSIGCGNNITNVTWGQGNHNVSIWINDTSNNLGNAYVSFNIDSVPPVIVEPANATLEYLDEPLNVDFNATDVGVGVGNFSINWTSNFSIATNGTLINSSLLPIGTFFINVSINDTLGNTNSTIYQVTIEDTTLPIIIEPPNSTLEANDTALLVDFNATDYLAVGNFSINWTSEFSITSDGTLTNTTLLDIGTFFINVSVNDTTGNLNSTIYQVTIEDTTNPVLVINSPTNTTNSSNSGLNVKYVYNETNCKNVTWQDGTGTNTTLASCGTNITTATWGEGNHNITIFMRDTTNNLGKAYISFKTDTTDPNVTIYTANATSLVAGVLTISINFTATDTNRKSCYYTVYNSLGAIHNGLSNTSTTDCSSGLQEINVLTFDTFTAQFWSEDYAENLGDANITFTTVAEGGGGSGGGGGGGGGDVIVPEDEETTTPPTTGTYCGDGVCQATGNDLGIYETFWSCSQDCPGAIGENFDELIYYLTKNCFDNDDATACFWSFAQTFSISPSTQTASFNSDTIFGNCFDNDDATACFWSSARGSLAVFFLVSFLMFFFFARIEDKDKKKKRTPYQYLVIKAKKGRKKR